MQSNRLLHISTAGSRKAMHWPTAEILWSEFCDRLKNPVRGTETIGEYLAMPKSRQAELKDVGGYVGGTFAGERRKAANVQGRDLATLDLDNIPAGQTEDILRRVGGLGCAALVYSTRKHTGYAPRLRVVIPFDRTAAADEYEPAARKLGQLLGMEFCDPTTFEPSRLMYWASCCSDGEYVYQVYDGGFCSVDGVLAMYGDWKDVTQWPQVPGAETIEKRRLTKQEDPTGKRGVVGAFCRTYSITQAMDTFLPGVYEETAVPGRYTYTGGSTAGGAVVYDGDLFLYSHHATDPCSGQLVNAWDLVRLHKFGQMDDEAKEGTPPVKLPSYAAMTRLALGDKAVSDRMAREKFEAAKEAFKGAAGALPGAAGAALEDDLNWMSRLAVDQSGNYKKTINNLIIILQNDPLLKGKIVTDDFASRGLVLGSVPWSPQEGKRWWTDNDDSGALWYVENYYNLSDRGRLSDALAIVGGQNRINDVKRYLEGLTWDGTRRVDTLLSDYLGAEDTPYTRAVIRKSLAAAVARALSAGVKYDCMPIFTGPQGIGKSTFLSVLGGEWFSDSLTSFEGKEAAEMIQGTWINEVGELTAFTRQETESIKQFLSKKEDIYRAAYGKRTEKYPRRCVFFGTSNAGEFLKDTTGNRRFWPVDVGLHPAKKSVWEDLPRERDQIWAEARMYWILGEPLFLSKELEDLAREQQEGHMELTGKEGIVKEFLEKPILPNWRELSIGQHRQFWSGNLQYGEETQLVPRETVCAMEILVECFGANLSRISKSDSREINAILVQLPGWKRNKAARRYGKEYGTQKGFERV